MPRLLALAERDALFDAYRRWLALNTALTSHMDAAMKGQSIDWSVVDRETALLDRFQHDFVTRLRSTLDEDELDPSVGPSLSRLLGELKPPMSQPP